ncbi:MAG TPA: Uxx-star family glutaredoxin-like (seleno)protein [Anaerolineae bacterium]|nr:Uxx-star family glutaredoxin-like (seleno)protein [Anaerolineae bacterium]
MSEVVVYTTPTCGYCHQVKQYLEQRQIPFREIDVAADPQAASEMVNLSGQRGVPVVVIDGQVVVGFNTSRIDQLLSSPATRRPQLGVSVADAKKMVQKQGSGPTEGAYVGNVRPLSAGDRAGLVTGDVIVALAGHAIADAHGLEATLSSLVPGETVSLVFVRGGERITARVTP